MVKKYIVILSVTLMSFFLLTSCGSQPKENGGDSTAKIAETAEALSTDNLKTLGDVDALDVEDLQTSVTENKAIYAFGYQGTYYRVTASISDEDQQAYIDIDFADEDYEDQQKKILAPLKVEKLENLSEQILTQDELDALTGKTGKELLEDGWVCTGNYDLEAKEFYLDHGPFQYAVTFDGEIAVEDVEDFDEEAGIQDLTVKSAEFNTLGDATSLE